MSADLLKRLMAQRERWVDLGGRKRVCFLRPAQTELRGLSGANFVDVAAKAVIRWEGFTEADILGPALGSDATAQFSPELWSEVAKDRLDYVEKVVEAIVAEADKLIQEIAAVSGN